MSKIYRKFKKTEHEPGVKDGFWVAAGLITAGILALFGAGGFAGLYMWLQTL